MTVGQSVKVGDTLGLMGNTGNARTTPPHLHFAIYTSEGAIDPLPFVNHNRSPLRKPPNDLVQGEKTLKKTAANASLYSAPASNARKLKTLAKDTYVKITANTHNFYKATLADGTTGFISHSQILNLDKPIRKTSIVEKQFLLAFPDSLAAAKSELADGTIDVLAVHDRYPFVRHGETKGWIFDHRN